MGGSNSGPLDYEADVLPTAPRRQTKKSAFFCISPELPEVDLTIHDFTDVLDNY